MPSVRPARSRHFPSSTSASGLLQRYLNLVRKLADGEIYLLLAAHGPQKARPRISTSARRRQGLSVLLRSWQLPGFVIASVKETPSETVYTASSRALPALK